MKSSAKKPEIAIISGTGLKNFLTISSILQNLDPQLSMKTCQLYMWTCRSRIAQKFEKRSSKPQKDAKSKFLTVRFWFALVDLGFETPTEVEMFRRLSLDLVGMTSVAEAILSRKLEMYYANVCFVANMAAGL